MKIELNLTEQEVALLRSSISDLGMNDPHSVGLQLKVEHAIASLQTLETLSNTLTGN